MKKLTLAVILGLMTASAMADPVVGKVVPGSETIVSADLTFSATSMVKATLTPASNLTAGNIADKTVLATLTGESSNGNGWAFRPPSNTATQYTDPSNDAVMTLVGAQDSSHKLQLFVNNYDSYVVGVVPPDSQGKGMYTALVDNARVDIESYGDQNVPADSYKLSFEVAAFQP